jgi:hypothetical protein
VSEGERLLSQVALAVTCAAATGAAFAATAALVAGHTEGVDAAVFLCSFGVLLPGTVLTVVRGGPLRSADPAVLSTLAGIAAIGLVSVLAAARVLDEVAGAEPRGAAVVLALVAVWAGAMSIPVARARRGDSPLGSGRKVPAVPAWMPIALLPLVALTLAWDALPEPGTLLLSVLLGGALLAVHLLLRPAERLGRWGTIALDVAFAVAILLVVSDVSVFTPDAAAWGLQLHHDSLLGSANDVIGGRTVLVDTYSIYGAGSIYFLAGLFEIVPIGYGTFGLLVGIGLAVMYAGAYAIMRLAGCSPLLAATAMAAAIVSSVYSTVATPATFPSLGILRWGFAYLLVGLAIWAVRDPRRAPPLRIASAVVVGVSSVWSFEVFIYTGATYAALQAYLAAIDSSPQTRLRAFARSLVPALLACVIAHVALAAFTLVRAGELPSWGPYIAIVREFSSGPYNRFVAPPWWVGIPACAFLFASIVAVAAIATRMPGAERENRPALIAVAGLTAFAVAAFTYGVRFSTDDYVARWDLPALMAMALWIQIADRSALARPARIAVAATGFWVAAILIVGGWDSLEREGGRSALVAALPANGRSIESEASRVWDNPPVQPRAGAAEMLLERYWPGQDEALVLLQSDLAVEALMRSERVNQLPVSAYLADTLVSEESWERVRPSVDEIEPGTLMLTEPFYLEAGATRDYVNPGSPPLELEQLVIDRIRERFRLRPVATEQVGFDPGMGDDELVVVRLVPRR